MFSNFGVFVHVPTRDNPNFDYKGFITGYLGIPLYLIMILGYKIIMKSRGKTALNADIFTSKDIIDREEREFLDQKAANEGKQRRGWFYKHFVAWLF